MSEEEAIENITKQLEGTKQANECGLATKGEFKKEIESLETVLQLLERKDTIINTMQAEFERLEDLEDNTDMLKKKINELEKENIYLKAKNINTLANIKNEVKAKIYDNFDKIFFDDCDKKEKLQAILVVEKFNKENKYRDCAKINNAIDILLYLAKEQLHSIPKSVIHNKIEECRNLIKTKSEYELKEIGTNKIQLLYKITVLKELL